jgi:hypothetical protein
VDELLAHRGHADVAAVINCVARLSRALRPDDDPGVCQGLRSGVSAKGAPYSKPAAGKVKVRCAKWESGCTVSSKGENARI